MLVLQGADDAADSGGDDGVGAGRRAAFETARFEADVKRAAAGPFARFLERENLGVLPAVIGVETASGGQARGVADESADHGVGARQASSLAGETEGFAEVIAVFGHHPSNSDRTKLLASNGTRSSARSPTPT